MNIDFRSIKNLEKKIGINYTQLFNLRNLRILTLFSNILLFLGLILINAFILNQGYTFP